MAGRKINQLYFNNMSNIVIHAVIAIIVIITCHSQSFLCGVSYVMFRFTNHIVTYDYPPDSQVYIVGIYEGKMLH